MASLQEEVVAKMKLGAQRQARSVGEAVIEVGAMVREWRRQTLADAVSDVLRQSSFEQHLDERINRIESQQGRILEALGIAGSGPAALPPATPDPGSPVPPAVTKAAGARRAAKASAAGSVPAPATRSAGSARTAASGRGARTAGGAARGATAGRTSRQVGAGEPAPLPRKAGTRTQKASDATPDPAAPARPRPRRAQGR